MEKDLNIHVTYKSETSILITKRSEFLTRVARKFGLEEDEIEIYLLEGRNNTRKKIGVDKLEDIIRVEIVKKVSAAISEQNGYSQRANIQTFNAVGEPSASRVPVVEEICHKLRENIAMTEAERDLLIRHLQVLPLNLKRRMESGDHHPPEMKNRKVQANPIDQKSAYTQTDPLLNFDPNQNTSKNVQDLLQEIKHIGRKEKVDPRLVNEKMTQTFIDRRTLILTKHPPIAHIKEQFAILFTLSEIRNELDRILSDGSGNRFIRNIEIYAEHILSMAKDDDPLLLTTMQKKRSLATPLQKKYAVEVGSILMLTSLINEQRTFLKLDDTSFAVGIHPYIEAKARLHDIFTDKYTFKVYTEKILICEPTNFKEAILCLMACYFVFNIQYADEVANTLVVMEKLYLEANDTHLDDVDDFTRQIIKSIQLKAGARRS